MNRSCALFLLVAACSKPSPAPEATPAATAAPPSPPGSASETAIPEQGIVELTTTDITTMADFRADRASVLGAQLGMTMDAAKERVDRDGRFDARVDAANRTRMYVHPKAAGDGVLYLIWSPGNPRMTQITVFRSFAPWLVGGTKRLLTNEALDKTSAIGRFLGKPDRAAITLDVPSIRLKHITRVYDRRGMQVTEQHDADATKAVFALVSPDNDLGTTWIPLPEGQW